MDVFVKIETNYEITLEVSVIKKSKIELQNVLSK